MKEIISRAEKLQKEIRQRTWISRVKKQRKRYLPRALKGRPVGKPREWEKVFADRVSFFFWMGLGVLMLAVSWTLFWRTGEVSFEYSPVIENRVQEENSKKRLDEQERMEISETEKGGETWFREILGVEIRLQEGKIVFFQEKKEKVLEEE